MQLKFFLCVTALLGLSLTTMAQPLPEMLDTKGFRGGIAITGNLYIAGQPTNEEALKQLKERGLTRVINLRTIEEMEDKKSTPINEEQLLEDLGVSYVQIESGGEDHPFKPVTLDAFADAYRQADGAVLLHCNSAKRASHLWVAYLVKYQHMPLSEALVHGRAINFGSMPLEGYLEGEITFEYHKKEP